jgi:hypothetical protein
MSHKEFAGSERNLSTDALTEFKDKIKGQSSLIAI